MTILSVLISYATVALLLWWVFGECGTTPGSRMLGRWHKAARPGVRPHGCDPPAIGIGALLALPAVGLAVQPAGRRAPAAGPAGRPDGSLII